MRRRLSLFVAATTSAVVVAFLIPLALLLRNLAEERALAAAAAQNQRALLAAVSQPNLNRAASAVSGLVGDLPDGRTTVYLPDGRHLGPDPANPLVTQARRTGKIFASQVTDAGADVYALSAGDLGTVIARTAITRDRLREGVAITVATLAAGGMVLLLAAMWAANRVGRRYSAPIGELARGAEQLRDGLLDVRLPERGTAEVMTVANTLNQLAARVQELQSSERDAVADLSHRLRTPVTALRLDTDSITDTETAERLREHVLQLERTVDAIVHDARRPSRGGVTNSCDVGKVVSDRVAFWSALAEEQGRQLDLSVPDRPLRARLNESDLADVVDVLIDNVFAHTDEGVPLSVWVVPRADGAAVLTVEDGGPGLPQADIIARGSSGAGSTGLGMDIARRAANASGGRMELGRSRLGGALVRVVLGPVAR